MSMFHRFRCLLHTSPFRTLTHATTKHTSTFSHKLATPQTLTCLQTHPFHTDASFHDTADSTLNTIQDSFDDLIFNNDALFSNAEVNFASGVLTMNLPPHGIWVINKQTPNRQLWWSSPVSGPRRYEWQEGRDRWIYTRNSEIHWELGYLGDILNKEIKELFGVELGIEI